MTPLPAMSAYEIKDALRQANSRKRKISNLITKLLKPTAGQIVTGNSLELIEQLHEQREKVQLEIDKLQAMAK